MLKRLHIKNFTVFADAKFEFGPGLNVLVGTNGTGKSHVLKLGYSALNCLFRRVEATKPDSLPNEASTGANIPDAKHPDFADLHEKLLRVFRPSPFLVSEFVRRDSASLAASVQYNLDDVEILSGRFSINGSDSSSEAPIPLLPSVITRLANALAAPVFIPAKEILTLGWMLPASEQLRLPLDETYLDLLKQLNRLPLKKPMAAAVLQQLTQQIGGEVEAEGSRFYVSFAKQKPMDVNLVAEGLRKFGTLQRLLSNGSLTPQATLFWDEPESNLNPALLRELAKILAKLARQGFQIILATHSMSLLKQFHILSREKHELPLPIRYFGLNAAPGESTIVVAVDDFELLPDIVALNVELEQADALEEIFAREDQLPNANHH